MTATLTLPDGTTAPLIDETAPLQYKSLLATIALDARIDPRGGSAGMPVEDLVALIFGYPATLPGNRAALDRLARLEPRATVRVEIGDGHTLETEGP